MTIQRNFPLLANKRGLPITYIKLADLEVTKDQVSQVELNIVAARKVLDGLKLKAKEERELRPYNLNTMCRKSLYKVVIVES